MTTQRDPLEQYKGWSMLDYLADACRAQADQFRAEQRAAQTAFIADTQRNLQQFTEALAKPVEGDTGQEEA